MKPSSPTEDASGIDVSVIVVNWNTRDLLRGCLQSLRVVKSDFGLEVIVIDNASEDGSQEMVAGEFPDVRLIRNDGNRGFAAANNQGLKLARGRHALLLNSDAVLMPGALERVVDAADSDPKLGMVGCRVLNPDGSLQISCMRFPDFRGLLASALFLPRLFPRGRGLGYEDLTWWNHDDDRDVEVLKGCFILVRAEAMREVGLLDERFWLYGEETDWCRRMWNHGWRVRFVHGGEIIHHGGASTSQTSGRSLQQLWGAKLQFIAKHRNPMQLLLCRAAVALWFGLRILPALAAAVVDRSRSEFHLRRAEACAAGLFKVVFLGAGSLVRKVEIPDQA